jgi:hypothetical protein
MEPEGSLLCSRKSTTGSCSEVHQSILHSISSKSTLMLFLHLRLCLPSCLLPSDFSSETQSLYVTRLLHIPPLPSVVSAQVPCSQTYGQCFRPQGEVMLPAQVPCSQTYGQCFRPQGEVMLNTQKTSPAIFGIFYFIRWS